MTRFRQQNGRFIRSLLEVVASYSLAGIVSVGGKFRKVPDIITVEPRTLPEADNLPRTDNAEVTIDFSMPVM